MSEVQWVVDRAKLYDLRQQYPSWSKEELAQEVGRSLSWIRKWLTRFAEGDENDPHLFCSQSRARHHSPPRINEAVVKSILEIRDHPPENLRRVPGPKTILYYLHRCPKLKETTHYLPRSTSTIWRILEENQRIQRRQPPKRQPEERPEPMTHWQFDFKAVSSVPPEASGKKRHVVETLNVIDKGSSILVAARARADFHAQTTLTTLVDIFDQNGLPDFVTFDRDPRFIGPWNTQEFPSAMMRFLHVIGVTPLICPAHRPDKNGFVERYHRSYDEECLKIERPDNLLKVAEVTATFQHHYNHERPHQGLACGNQPPRVAFPEAKAKRVLPTRVDPDSWLKAAARRRYQRRVNHNGSIQIGGMPTM